jgi:glutathione S-transferase
MLQEIGVPYEFTQIAAAERRSSDHLRRHPLERVPALELGDGTTMFESAAICLQLAYLYPEARSIPRPGSPDRALAYQWVVFGMIELDAPLRRWIRDLSRGASDSRTPRTRSSRRWAKGEWLLGRQFTATDVICASVLAGANSRDLLPEWPGMRLRRARRGAPGVRPRSRDLGPSAQLRQPSEQGAETRSRNTGASTDPGYAGVSAGLGRASASSGSRGRVAARATMRKS